MLEDRSYPKLLLLGLCGAFVATLLVTAGTSSASLAVFNSQWDGTSEVRTTAETVDSDPSIARNVSAYQRTTPNETLAVVLSPSSEYTSREREAVASFVQDGGTLLVAEDYGEYGNDLLATVGAEARVTGVPLRDDQRAGPSPAFPRAYPVANHTYTTGVDGIMLNHGSSIDPGEASTLVHSSSYSYLDTNRNGQLDTSESLRERPVVTAESVGEGTVVVVSDPSIFLNSMLDRSDNAAFLRTLLSPHEEVIIDVSHSASVPPLVALRLTLEGTPLGLFLTGVCSVVLLILFASNRDIVSRVRDWRQTPVEPSGLSESTVASTIRARHPEWDEERVQRVTSSFLTTRQQGETDD